MALFLPAFDRTVLGNEGPYDNDPKDPGGETVWGITRKYQASWPGWFIIDAVPPDKRAAFSAEQGRIEASPLNACIKSFYNNGPWAGIRGNEIPDQAIAEELFDSAVNCGVVTAVKWLQRALNIFNLQGLDYPDIEVDGYFGQQTLECLVQFYAKRGPDIMLKALDAQQGMHYMQIAEKNPNLEKFEAGWWTRRIG